MATLVHYTVMREFMLQDTENQRRIERGEKPVAIMPGDMSKKLGVNEATVRKILRENKLWKKEHKDAAKVETLNRINASKSEHGLPSLEKQRQAGFSNLVKARQVLAQKHAERKKLEASELANA